MATPAPIAFNYTDCIIIFNIIQNLTSTNVFYYLPDSIIDNIIYNNSGNGYISICNSLIL